MNFCKIVFLLVTVFMAIFHAKYAFKIHTNLTDKEIEKLGRYYKYNQYLFNFLGSIIGWLVGYILVFYRVYPSYNDGTIQISNIDVILLIIFFIGASGYLPYATIKIVNSIQKISDLISK